jgi:trehalose/maltose transport system substrate-binding protein
MLRTHALIPALSAMLALVPGSSSLAQVTVSISCSSLGIELELCRSGADAWAAETGNQVNLVSTPADANERLSLYQTLLAAGSADIDIFQVDVVWPGILANHFIDLRELFPAEELSDHFEELLANNEIGGKLVAVPFFVDAGLLYYRKDLLEAHGRAVPKSWAELTETAQLIVDAERAGGNTGMQGYVWQGRSYEGLTCNAIEWVASFGGGTIVDAEGQITIGNLQAADALTMAAGWIGTISPEGVLNYAEEEARGVFQSGDAVFMRNWPYAWALANADDSPVKDKVGVAVLPQGAGEGARHAAALGGQQLAVSKYSVHPAEAADLVRHLTSAAEQKRRALLGSFNPTRRSLYADPELLAANPFYAEFLAVLDSAVARPSTVAGAKYNQLSSEFTRAVHNTLSGQGTAEENLDELAQSLDRLSRGGRW